MTETPRVFFISSIFIGAMGFLTIPLYTRFLSVEEMGVVTIFFTYGVSIISFFSFGLNNYIYRSFFIDEKNIFKKKFFSIIFVLEFIYLFIFFIFYFLNEYISHYIFNNKISPYILNLSILFGILVVTYNYFINLINASLDGKKFFFLTGGRVLGELCLFLLLIFFFNIENLVARIESSLLISIIFLFFSLYFTKKFLSFNFSKLFFYSGIKFSYPDTIGSFLSMINSLFDKTMLVSITNSSSVGLYAIAEKFSTILKILIDSIAKIFNVFFLKKFAENNKEEISTKIKNIFPIYCLITLAVITFIEELITLLTPQQYHFTSIICIFFIFKIFFSSTLNLLSSNQILASGKMIYNLYCNVFCAVSNIALNIIFIPVFGLIGAVAALIISEFFTELLRLYFGNKFYKVNFINKKNIINFLYFFISFLLISFLIYSSISFEIKFLFKLLILIFFIIFIKYYNRYNFLYIINLKFLLNNEKY